MLYAICNIDGDVLSLEPERGRIRVGLWEDVDDAADAARRLLEDDPELRELNVWEVHPSGNLLTHHRTITFGPDANWNSVVVVLKPGEHVQAPGPIPHRISEEDLDGYSLDDPKRAALEGRLGEWA